MSELLEKLASNLKEVSERSSDFMDTVKKANFLPDTFPVNELSGYDQILQGLRKGSPEAASVILENIIIVFYDLREEHFSHSDSNALDESGQPVPLRNEQLDNKLSLLASSLGTAHAIARKIQNLKPLQPAQGKLKQLDSQMSFVPETRRSAKVAVEASVELHAKISVEVNADLETGAKLLSKLWDVGSFGRLIDLFLQVKDLSIDQFQKVGDFVSKLPEHIETAMKVFKIAVNFGETTGQQLADGLSAVTKLCAGGLRTFADNVSKTAKAFAKLHDGPDGGNVPPIKPSWASNSDTDTYGRWAEFEYKGIVQRLRWCPAGSFLMGSPEGEKERYNDEGPQTEVTLKSGFWMFDTAVTQELYTAVMGENSSDFQTGEDAGKRPVENVSWNDVQLFLQKLNKVKTIQGLSLSLPSEAEWEYACRAGTSGPRYADDLDAIAWYNKNSNRQTHPVAQKVANPWGLYDTLGNVREWCADAWKGNHEGADPTGLPRQYRSVTTYRVVRGGAWYNTARLGRAACRLRGAPGSRLGYLGFRPILSEGQSKSVTYDDNSDKVNTKQEKADVGWMSLMVASQNGHVAVVDSLIATGIDVNLRRTDNGATALMAASIGGHVEVAGRLIAAGADVNQKRTSDGFTALMLASQEGWTEVVEVLMTAGADVNQGRTDNGATALMLASQSGYLEVVEMLITAGADVNYGKTDDGFTALMAASIGGHVEVAGRLIAAGADISQRRTNDGFTALTFASQSGHVEVVEMLIAAGVKE